MTAPNGTATAALVHTLTDFAATTGKDRLTGQVSMVPPFCSTFRLNEPRPKHLVNSFGGRRPTHIHLSMARQTIFGGYREP